MTVDIYSLGMMISPLEVVRLVVVGQEAEVGDRATMRHRNIGNAGEPARVEKSECEIGRGVCPKWYRLSWWLRSARAAPP
jgi:hypothetical protein